jgi:DNA-directed RNA polymerase subunit RPC12/RpoP
MIDVSCSQCGAVYHAEKAYVGKQLRCTKCGSVVPIVMEVARAVVQHLSSSPTIKSHTVNRSPKHRRIYSFAVVAIVIAVLAISIALLRHPDVRRQGTTLSDIKEPSASQSIQKVENPDQWQITGEDPIPAPSQQTSRPIQLDPRPTDYNSLPTGTRIENDIGTDGNGKLAVENGTSEDAVVRLSQLATTQTLLLFFVQAHRSAQVARIPEGSYRLAFTTGLNWVESENAFSWQPSYAEFDRIFEYREQRGSEGVQYKSISVTLHPVVFGNVRTKPITRDEFLSGYRHTIGRVRGQ